MKLYFIWLVPRSPTVHERNIATFCNWFCAGLLSPRPPAPLISVLGVVVILFSDLFPAPSQHWNWGSGGISSVSDTSKMLQYFFRVPWEIESQIKWNTISWEVVSCLLVAASSTTESGVVAIYNRLPQHVVDWHTMSAFQTKLTKSVCCNCQLADTCWHKFFNGRCTCCES